MKNDEIVKALPNLKSLKHEHEALKRQIKNLLKQEQQLQHEISVIERVTEVFEGVALEVRETDGTNGKRFNVHNVAYEESRWAEVYPNAHTNGGNWGVTLRASGVGNEDWLGTGWPYKAACLIARRYVALGEKPTEAFKDMTITRHMLDPDGNATKRRRDAYEAAFMAGQTALAGELLLGGKEKFESRLGVLEALKKKAKAS